MCAAGRGPKSGDISEVARSSNGEEMQMGDSREVGPGSYSFPWPVRAGSKIRASNYRGGQSTMAQN